MSTVTVYKRHLPEDIRNGMRLGRHVNHDSRSKNFRIAHGAQMVTKTWKRETPILDQGNLGSCTGNASVGILGTEPHWSALSQLINQGGLSLDEPEAITVYSKATAIDSYQGTYPPDDTGSDGLSAAKACQQLGLIKGYTHALSVDDMIAGLQLGPMITGTNWYEGMDSPNPTSGLVVPTGKVRGGHEYATFGVDMENELFRFDNSWGNWGVNGSFCYSFKSAEKLLKEDGDSTYFIPITGDAPTPSLTADQVLIKALDPWAAEKASQKAGASAHARAAYEAWKLAVS